MTKLANAELEKIVSGEHWQDNLSGVAWNKQVQEAVLLKHTHEIRLFRAQDDLKKLEEAYLERDLNLYTARALSRMIDASCVCTLRGKADPRIKEIGFNKVDDLFTNNFGVWVNMWLVGLNQATSGYTMVDITGASRTTQYTAYDNNYGIFAGSVNAGTQIQFGSSSTAAQRSDYCLGTPFVAAPESGRFPSGSGGSAGGSISFGTVAAAGGSGTINELGWFGYWYYYSGNLYTFMLTHDILGSGVAFVAGDPLVGSFNIAI